MLLQEIVKSRFKNLLEKELISEIVEHGKLHTVEAGTVIIQPGAFVKFVPLLIHGSIKVMQVEESGKELYLYHLYPGQTCAVSLNCCLGLTQSEIKAVAEEDTEFIAIPVKFVDEWMSKYQSWKVFIMQTHHDRFNELIRTINNIAFSKLDERLYKYLHDKSKALKTKTINITHQQVADELGSSREVVSRLLKVLEKDGKLELGRNTISLRT
jgi:CRP/FNR family transcriptional regulator, anaerobic regulatory protein